MKRAQIQLDEEVYDLLRRRAFQEKKSIAGVIREIIRKEIISSDLSRFSSIKDFRFIAAGKSRQGGLKPVSERHDEALKEVFQKLWTIGYKFSRLSSTQRPSLTSFNTLTIYRMGIWSGD
jgi:predicted CopG family antitoxin